MHQDLKRGVEYVKGKLPSPRQKRYFRVTFNLLGVFFAVWFINMTELEKAFIYRMLFVLPWDILATMTRTLLTFAICVAIAYAVALTLLMWAVFIPVAQRAVQGWYSFPMLGMTYIVAWKVGSDEMLIYTMEAMIVSVHIVYSVFNNEVNRTYDASHGFETDDTELMATNDYGMKRWKFVRYYLLYKCRPDFITGCTMALGRMWPFAIFVEPFGGMHKQGLGVRFVYAFDNVQMKFVVIVIVLIIGFSIVSQTIVKVVDKLVQRISDETNERRYYARKRGR